MCTYLCLYRGHKATLEANGTYAAQLEYARQFNVPVKKIYLISVHLVKRADGTEVVHSTAGISATRRRRSFRNRLLNNG